MHVDFSMIKMNKAQREDTDKEILDLCRDKLGISIQQRDLEIVLFSNYRIREEVSLYSMFIISQLWLTSHPRNTVVLFIYLFKILKLYKVAHPTRGRGAEVKRIHVCEIY